MCDELGQRRDEEGAPPRSRTDTLDEVLQIVADLRGQGTKSAVGGRR